MVNAFNSRSETNSIFRIGIFSNLYLFGAIAISVLATIAFVEVPFLQNYMHTTGLNLTDWTVVFSFSLLILVIEETRKLIVRRKNA
jgi:Ca2+-transporting ATPase